MLLSKAPEANKKLPKYDDSHAWQQFFSSILSDKKSAFSVQAFEHSIELQTSDENLVSHLQNILGSPSTIQQQLSYELMSTKSASPHLTLTSFDETPDIANFDFTTFTRALFDTSTSMMLGLNGKVTDDTDMQTVSIDIGKPDSTLNKWYEGTINTLKQLLNIELSTLRSIFLEKRDPLTIDGHSTSSESTELTKFMPDIINTSENKLHINYGFLLQLLFPPRPQLSYEEELEENSNKMYTIRYPRVALNNYLASVFREGFFLKPNTNNTANSFLLSAQSPKIPDNQYILLLDCSGSMESVMSSYKEQVNNFVADIIKVAGENDEIKLVAFNTQATSKTFRVSELQKNPEPIFAWVGNLEANFRTRLKGTLSDALTSAEKSTKETVVVVFSDGLDNESTLEEQKALTKKSEELARSSMPTKIYTVGLGDYYEEKLFNFLSNSTACTHIKLDSMEDFAQINQELGKMQIPREIVEFMQSTMSDCKPQRYPAYQGHLSKGPLLELDNPFTVNGQKYTATKVEVIHTHRGPMTFITQSTQTLEELASKEPEVPEEKTEMSNSKEIRTTHTSHI